MDGVFKEERLRLFQSGRKNDRCQAQSPRKPVLRKRPQTVERNPSVCGSLTSWKTSRARCSSALPSKLKQCLLLSKNSRQR